MTTIKAKSYTLLAALLLTLTLLLTACAQGTGSSSAPSATTTTAAVTEAALPKTDREGTAITLPENASKIVSLAPATTQLLLDLGLKDRIIAVDTNSASFSSELSKDLPTFDLMKIDTEKLFALKPDLVFVTAMSTVDGANPFEALRNLGVCVAVIPSSVSIAGVEEDVQFIADCVKKSTEGKKIVDAMKADVAKISAIGKTITEKKSVLFEIAAAPYIYSFGTDTFLDEMLTLIGAKNVLADQKSWVSVTNEAAVTANPDVILTNVNYIEDPVAEIKARAGWNVLTAVKNNAVYVIDNNASTQPNQHILKAMLQMAQAIYPDAYASVTLSTVA